MLNADAIDRIKAAKIQVAMDERISRLEAMIATLLRERLRGTKSNE